MFQFSVPTARLGRGLSPVLGFLLAVGLLLAAALSGTASSQVTDLHITAVKRSGTMFRVATFNLLGANHTEHSSRFATYDVRMPKAIQLIDQQDFSIVGLQEFQIPQYDLWSASQSTSWGVYPGMEEGRRPVQNSIIWRKDTWSLVEKHLYEIPYFHGRMVPEPYVKLRNNSGDTVWVIDTHNPADTHGPAERYRNRAEQIQIDLVKQLEGTGVPVLLVGDFNEKADVYCNITGNTNMQATNPGSWSGGTCHPPRYIRIDWIFRSPDLQSSNYTALDNDLVHQITDHKVIYSDLNIP
jgi:endonuclease/exonuclease/phosphatase family metal-dependent hydrolase